MTFFSAARPPIFCAFSLAALAACSGRAASDERGATGTTRELVTAAPLYAIDWHPRSSYSSSVSVRAAEVDDSGNTWVLGGFLGCADCPYDFFAFEFDPNGAFVTQVEVVSGANASTSASKLRVNATGLVGGGERTENRVRYALVERFDTSKRQMFEAKLPSTGGLGGVDLCADGSAVALTLQGQSTNVVSLDTSGNALWTTPLTGMTGTKVRCTGSGPIYVAGTAGGVASLARLESDGTLDWTWRSPDAASFASFDLGNDGNADVVTGDHVYSVASDGTLSWSVAATQPLVGVSAADVVAVAGSTASSGGQYYTGSYDGSGNAVCSIGDATMSGSAFGIALDDVDDAFLCGQSGAALYGQDGSTQWTYQGNVPGTRADVTNGVARCIGASATRGIAIVAFAVP